MAKWQVTKDQMENVSRPLLDIKRKYAEEVARFVETLPEEYHQYAFYESLSVKLPITEEFCRKLGCS